MNEQNLKPIRSSSEARERGRKGGIASGRARLAKKHGRELVRALLSMPETDERLLAEIEALGIAPKDATSEVVMHARLIQKAKRKADTEAYKAINKAAGYMEEEAGAGNTFKVVITQETADALDKWVQK